MHGAPKPLKSVRGIALRLANGFLSQVQDESQAVNFGVDFARGKGRRKLDGPFCDDDIASMLESKHLKMVQQLMPFVAALIDRMCGSGDGKMGVASLLTKAFALYADMDKEITRSEKVEPGFTENSIGQIGRQHSEF